MAQMRALRNGLQGNNQDDGPLNDPIQIPKPGPAGGDEEFNHNAGPGNMPPLPGGVDGEEGRGGETPQERQQGGGAVPTIRRPPTPTPMAGSSFQAPTGPQPFQPMGGGMGLSAMAGLGGATGGLKGGGLGVPLDPTNVNANGDINQLIQMLTQMGKGSF